MSFLSFCIGRLLHFSQVLLQGIDMLRPEAAEGNEPFVELRKRLRSQSIEATLRLDSGLDEPRLSQHAQVFGDGRLRQPKLALDLSHGALGREQQAQDGPSVGLRYDGECRFHGGYMARGLYVCQGICGSISRPPDRVYLHDITPNASA